jgi:putative transposase
MDMKYNPKIHHRRSIRLKGYDYSQAGLYFITICVKNWECLYGHISNGEMILNDAGKMVEKWYYELENKFPDIRCDEMIVMPNHFHCIIENVGTVGQTCVSAPITMGN